MKSFVSMMVVCVVSFFTNNAFAGLDLPCVPDVTSVDVGDYATYDVSFPDLKQIPAETSVNWKETKAFIVALHAARGENVVVQVTLPRHPNPTVARLTVMQDSKPALRSLSYGPKGYVLKTPEALPDATAKRYEAALKTLIANLSNTPIDRLPKPGFTVEPAGTLK